MWFLFLRRNNINRGIQRLSSISSSFNFMFSAVVEQVTGTGYHLSVVWVNNLSGKIHFCCLNTFSRKLKCLPLVLRRARDESLRQKCSKRWMNINCLSFCVVALFDLYPLLSQLKRYLLLMKESIRLLEREAIGLDNLCSFHFDHMICDCCLHDHHVDRQCIILFHFESMSST